MIILGIPEEKYIAHVRDSEPKGNDANKRHNSSDEFDRVQSVVTAYSKHGMIVCEKLKPILTPRVTRQMELLCSKCLHQLVRLGVFIGISVRIATR